MYVTPTNGSAQVIADAVMRDGSKFINTRYFSEAANGYLKNGYYTNAPYGSKDYREYWDEQYKRCLEGYSVGGVQLQRYHYFFLNFKPLNIVADPKARASKKIEAFPRFWDVHFDFFHAMQTAEDDGKHMTILKPRGTGFSEIMSTIGVHNFVLIPRSKSFYFAFDQGFLNKDGVLTKCWDHLNFLNTHTNRGMKRVRQAKDADLHKRASHFDGEGNERGYMSEIIGRVIDKPRKVRGARTGTWGKVYFEEGGSFPNLKEAVTTTRPLVEQGGVSTGQIVVWGTGGEQGPGIEGLEQMFLYPEAFNMFEFPNEWDDSLAGETCGYFFPTHWAMDRFMDNDGNCDRDKAYQFQMEERRKAKISSKMDEDHYVAEYPFKPSEALMRLTANDFPVREAQEQYLRVKSDPGIQGMLKNGWLIRDRETHRLKFQLDHKAQPIDKYPWREHDTTGCITMVEAPYKDQLGHVPSGMYTIVVDPYYKDETVTEGSLGACYVYKHANDMSETEDDLFVAWYVARPKTTEAFARIVFHLAEFYNAKVQSEIAGGGKGLLDYARVHKLTSYCCLEPDILYNNERQTKRTKAYFMNMPTDTKRLALSYYADWLRRERSLREGDDGSIIKVINVNKVYDIGMLEEIIKFNEDGNFDRISAGRILPFMIKEHVDRQIDARRADNFWDRELFTDQPNNNDHWLPPSELQNV